MVSKVHLPAIPSAVLSYILFVSSPWTIVDRPELRKYKQNKSQQAAWNLTMLASIQSSPLGLNNIMLLS